MSVHIGAETGQIADTVLLPGDPLRAKFVADTFLESVEQYNAVRGMLGFTGLWNGRRVSVQGSGMGQPSLSIYAHELLVDYGAKRLIRIGSCGAIQPDLDLMDIIVAMTASTDSSMNKRRFAGLDYAPCASPELFLNAMAVAADRNIPVRAGGILSSDTFYDDEDPEGWKTWARYGVLAVEMETNALYTLAARHGAEALTILTVSDSLVSGELLSSQDRQTGFKTMVELALALAR
jgi:purine-nucleoside phosphorylase